MKQLIHTPSAAVSHPWPFVSVIVPVLNEEDYVLQCLGSLLCQDYPQDRYEILVLDGGSTDRSVALVIQLKTYHPNLRLLSNQRVLASAALNIGCQQSRGEILVRLDAHCWAPPNYIRQCVAYLQSTFADTVGGVMKAEGSGYWGQAIATAITHWFGVGGSKHRCSRKQTTVEQGWPGAYWKNTVIEMGGFDEFVGPNDDDEFGFRLLRAGRAVFLTPEIQVIYYCRKSLAQLWKQFFRYGLWKPKVFRKHHAIISARHMIPGAFVLSVLATAALYLIGTSGPFLLLSGIYLTASFTISFVLAIKKRNAYFVFTLPATFVTLHASYGFGFLFGLVQLAFHPNRNIRNSDQNVAQ